MVKDIEEIADFVVFMIFGGCFLKAALVKGTVDA